jgi:ferrochelatase
MMKFKTFIATRYWHPMSDETALAVKAFGLDRIILLPLYLQYSTTTTGPSLSDWQRGASKAWLSAPTSVICCYPEEPGFIVTISEATHLALLEASNKGNPRILFSAHGLPEKIVVTGDPYPDHVEKMASEVVDKLDQPGLDWIVCYQSRVGPLQLIGPSTDDEIARAANDGVPVVVVPIAFVSEHSKTLVELDIEYCDRALSLGVPAYHRVVTVRPARDFIGGLKVLADKALQAINGGDRPQVFTISSVAGCKIWSTS